MSEPERSPGWTTFATITIAVAGAWNLLMGVAAFSRKEYFHEASLLYRNLGFYGVMWILIGLLQLLTAVLVARRTAAGKALGLIGASVSMLMWFFGIGAHPLASVLVIALDALILYALTADRPYGGAMYAGGDVRTADASMSTGRHFG